jgi:hypothetical protein
MILNYFWAFVHLLALIAIIWILAILNKYIWKKVNNPTNPNFVSVSIY